MPINRQSIEFTEKKVTIDAEDPNRETTLPTIMASHRTPMGKVNRPGYIFGNQLTSPGGNLDISSANTFFGDRLD
jgi:hypothetical protein